MLIVTTSSAHQRHKGLQSMKNGGFSRDVKAAILGNLSNNDSNGYENITWRRNSPSFKLYRAYSISFNSSIFSKFFWSWILKYCIEVHEKKKKVVVLCSHFAQKVKLGTFTLQSCSDGKKKCTKKFDARAKLLFCLSKPVTVLTFSLTSPSSLPKLPIAVPEKWNGGHVGVPNKSCGVSLNAFFCRHEFA